MSAQKAALRQSLLACRDALPVAQRAERSQRITERLLQLPAVTDARAVLAYASFGSEFDTSALVNAILAAGKQLALPRVDRSAHRLELYFVADWQRDLTPGVWGILEPAPARCRPATLNEVDVVLAPGVAFSPHCDRLGYGGGYYDRLLAGRPATPIAVAAAFDLQVLPALPLGPADVPVDLLITETATYRRPAI